MLIKKVEQNAQTYLDIFPAKSDDRIPITSVLAVVKAMV